MILGRRTRLELKVDHEEWLPDDFDDVNLMFHRWGFASAPQECAWSVAFDAERRIRSVTEVGRGTTKSMEIHIPTLLGGLLTSGSDRWIFVHNHPSGNPTPSASDFSLMEQLREVSHLCDLYLEDGVILTADPDRVYSMLISGTYFPRPYTQEAYDKEPSILEEARIEGQMSVSPA